MDATLHLDAEAQAGAESVCRFGEGPSRLSVLVPTYRDDPRALIAALSACEGAGEVEFILFDDGSGLDMSPAHAALENWPGPARCITAPANGGRAHARNRLLAQAESAWVLFLDADMLPDGPDFLARYIEALQPRSEPALICGGFSLQQVTPRPDQTLHALQSAASECLPADVRARAPGRYVFTSNLLVHRNVLEAIPFDEAYCGWGWEDVDWGFRVARHFPIRHIDNTATHTGLDTDTALMAKYAGSGANFARLVAQHPDETRQMALARAARALRILGSLRQPVQALAGRLARMRALPGRIRLAALKLFRAAAYAREMR